MSDVFQIAPMLDWSYSAFRILMRLLLPHVKLYTEMIVPRAIVQNSVRYLDYETMEHPVVLQLGGSVASELLEAALLAQKQGYQEINLNLGCPSDRVQAGKFGACLMKQPMLVCDRLKMLQDHLEIPVTVKTRIGVDEFDSYQFFQEFIGSIVDTGCRQIIVHARKAWLKGLNPKQNRSVPTINYQFVYDIQRDFPEVAFIINGEIKTVEQVQQHMNAVAGIMVGRLACDNPYYLQQIHAFFYPDTPLKSREQVLQEYLGMMALKHNKDRIGVYLKPLYSLYHGTMYAKLWKKCLQRALMMKSFTEVSNFVLQIKY